MCIRGAIKKLSARPSSIQNKIKIVFASYSSKAQNATCMQCDFWAINILCISAYEHSVCHMGVENANTRTAHKFLKTFSSDTDVIQQEIISQLDSESEQQSVQ